MRGFARFRRKQELTETVKLEDHPLGNETIMTDSCKKMIWDLNSIPVSESKDLNPAKGHLVIDASLNQQRKRLRNKFEKVLLVGSSSNSHINLAPTLKKSSSCQDLTLHEFLPVSNIKNKACNQGNASSFHQKTNKDSTHVPKFDSMILMSCFRCYMHVLVSETDPKCPKCGKRDRLLDMYRENHMKKAKIM